MKKIFHTPLEKQLLDKRGIVETDVGHLKENFLLWHTRHGSVFNALAHLVCALACYAIQPLRFSIAQTDENKMKMLYN